jgi:hypothetical protein
MAAVIDLVCPAPALPAEPLRSRVLARLEILGTAQKTFISAPSTW